MSTSDPYPLPAAPAEARPRTLVLANASSRARLLDDALRDISARVECPRSHCAAVECLESGAFDLIVLDTGGLDLPPQAVIAMLRTRSSAALVVVGDGGVESLVEALEAGADDYLSHPLRIAELHARARAVLRRRRRPEPEPEPEDVLELSDGVVVDFPRNAVRYDGREDALTDIERRLLQVLARHEGRVLSRAELMREVWGPMHADSPGSLYAYIASLRRKIETSPDGPRHIRTHHGVGYQFVR